MCIHDDIFLFRSRTVDSHRINVATKGRLSRPIARLCALGGTYLCASPFSSLCLLCLRSSCSSLPSSLRRLRSRERLFFCFSFSSLALDRVRFAGGLVGDRSTGLFLASAFARTWRPAEPFTVGRDFVCAAMMSGGSVVVTLVVSPLLSSVFWGGGVADCCCSCHHGGRSQPSIAALWRIHTDGRGGSAGGTGQAFGSPG